jgi:hypothetical protein
MMSRERGAVILFHINNVKYRLLIRSRKLGVLSRRREESDYVVQYNFYDATQAQLLGEVAKIAHVFRSNLINI